MVIPASTWSCVRELCPQTGFHIRGHPTTAPLPCTAGEGWGCCPACVPPLLLCCCLLIQHQFCSCNWELVTIITDIIYQRARRVLPASRSGSTSINTSLTAVPCAGSHVSVPCVCSLPSPLCWCSAVEQQLLSLVPIAHGCCLITEVAASRAPSSAAAPLGAASGLQGSHCGQQRLLSCSTIGCDGGCNRRTDTTQLPLKSKGHDSQQRPLGSPSHRSRATLCTLRPHCLQQLDLQVLGGQSPPRTLWHSWHCASNRSCISGSWGSRGADASELEPGVVKMKQTQQKLRVCPIAVAASQPGFH